MVSKLLLIKVRNSSLVVSVAAEAETTVTVTKLQDKTVVAAAVER